MNALIDIGEVSISDSGLGGCDYLLRPSFKAMSRIGTPEEIVKIYARLHGHETSYLNELCSLTKGTIPAWISPQLYRVADRVLESSMTVLQACCDEDLSSMIGEWKGWSRYVVYRPGKMHKPDIVFLAQHLMQHGIVGKAKVRRLQRNDHNEKSSQFRAVEYIVAAQTHFGMSESEASNLTMTSFQMLLAAKYPEQKGYTKEEYDKTTDDFFARRERRRAKAA